MLRSIVVALGASGSYACSHFTMDNDYIVTARTEDLYGEPQFLLITKPRGSKGLRSAKYGYVAFMDTNLRSGLNDAGLNCDKQTLGVATHPSASKTLDNIDAAKICQWALEGFSSIEEIKVGLRGVNFVKSTDPNFAFGHWALRDASGKGLVIEFTNFAMQVYDDNNDNGKTGYGIMTNDPPFPLHLKTIAALQAQERKTGGWGMHMPGDWSPTDRFKRIFLIKSNMPKPRDADDAIAQAIHTLNSVSVPNAEGPTGFFLGSTTQWSVVYDQKNLAVYWRTLHNQNMQRVRLADMGLSKFDPVSSPEKQLDVNSPKLPSFVDASADFQIRKPAAVIV